jgi:hypothetical protein
MLASASVTPEPPREFLDSTDVLIDGLLAQPRIPKRLNGVQCSRQRQIGDSQDLGEVEHSPGTLDCHVDVLGGRALGENRSLEVGQVVEKESTLVLSVRFSFGVI